MGGFSGVLGYKSEHYIQALKSLSLSLLYFFFFLGSCGFISTNLKDFSFSRRLFVLFYFKFGKLLDFEPKG